MTVTGEEGALIRALRFVETPEAFYPMAATALALMATAERPGALFAAHTILLATAHQAEGDPLDDSDWVLIRNVLAALADFVASPWPDSLDRVGRLWRTWRHPAALN